MVKNKEYYIEMYWNLVDKNGKFKSAIKKIDKKDPLLFDDYINRNIMIGFRFFDYDLDSNQRKNYSKMYYLGSKLDKEQMNSIYNNLINLMKEESLKTLNFNGKLLTIEDIEKIYCYLLEYVKENGFESVIYCSCGEIIMNPKSNSITIDEYIKNKNKLKIKN